MTSESWVEFVHIKALILAGGSGTRFWPKSTQEKPKQFLKITSNELTMIQETFQRIQKLVPKENIFIVTNKNHSHHIFEQLSISKDNVIFEAMAKNTAAAIALGISKFKNDDLAIVLPSDHYIQDVDEYVKTLKVAADFALKNEAIVTLGIKPKSAETGYGYIEVKKNSLSKSDTPGVIRVKRFHEKPNLETAYSYVESGNFFWNSGMFIFKVSTMWNAFKKYMPDLYKAFEKLRKIHDLKDISNVYPSLDSISIDYGVMEKADNIFVIPSDFGWSDVGSWDAVFELSQKDENGNYSSSKKALFRDSKNCAVFADNKTVAIAHLDDIIVVVNDEKILVIKRGTTQDVKKISEEF